MNKVCKHPRLELIDMFGDTFYVSKKLYDGITKKVFITSETTGHLHLIVEYRAKRGGGHGVLELYDIGPAPTKKEK